MNGIHFCLAWKQLSVYWSKLSSKARDSIEILNNTNKRLIIVVINDKKRAFEFVSSNKVPRSNILNLIKICKITIGNDSKHIWTIPLWISRPSHYSSFNPNIPLILARKKSLTSLWPFLPHNNPKNEHKSIILWMNSMTMK